MVTQASASTGSVAEWLAALESEGMSPKNREAHRMAVARLVEFMAPRDVTDAGPNDVRAFLAYLGQLGVSPHSQGVYRTILLKWLGHVAQARARAAEDLLTSTVPPRGAPVAKEVLVEQQDPGDTAVIATVEPEGDAGAPFEADSTWPLFAPVRRLAEPSPQGMAAAFDGAVSGRPAVAAVTIDFSAPVAVDEAMLVMDDQPEAIVAAPVASEPALVAPGPPPPTVEPEPPSASTGGWTPFMAEPAPSAFAEAPAPSFGEPAAAPSFAAYESSDPFASPPGATTPEGSGEGPSAREPASAFAFAAPLPEAAFGAPITAFAGAPAGADATPARPLAAVSPVVSRTASTTEMEMESGPSIALAVRSAPAVAREPERKPAAASPSAAREKLPGWSVRKDGHERHDLDLAQLRNMATTGALQPGTQIRKPGGEWMRAGEYQPLRSVFQQARDHAQVPAEAQRAARGPVAHPNARAVMGAIVGATLGCAAWWLAAVLMGGEELSGLALLIGALTGVGAGLFSRGECDRAPLIGALVTFVSMVAARAAVYETLVSGAIGSPALDVAGFAMRGVSPIALSCWAAGIGLAAGAALLVREAMRPH